MAKTTQHLVVVRYLTQRTASKSGPWTVMLFEDDKRLFRIGFHQEKAAVGMAAKLVIEIRENGWPCRWVVQDENGKPTGYDLLGFRKRERMTQEKVA